MQNSIFTITSDKQFKEKSLQVFKHQFERNSIYRSFCNLLYIHPDNVKRIQEIPFLPIQFFKSHKVVSNPNTIQEVFISSGSTESITSKHYVTDVSWYKKSYSKGFEFFYGNIQDYVILALLPDYLERKGSSLIFMVDDLIKQSKQSESGFYLHNLDNLSEKLTRLDREGKKVLLIGVSFALLDLIERDQFNLKNTIVMETGGMKGRRKELIKSELHQLLSKGFGVEKIHSEYGMTELLSQAYSKGNGVFKCPPWMKIITRETEDPLNILGTKKTGGINIIDLANYNSCSFIATQDLGRVIDYAHFEVIGRFDNSDIRGCNLMIL